MWRPLRYNLRGKLYLSGVGLSSDIYEFLKKVKKKERYNSNSVKSKLDFIISEKINLIYIYYSLFILIYIYSYILWFNVFHIAYNFLIRHIQCGT